MEGDVKDNERQLVVLGGAEAQVADVEGGRDGGLVVVGGQLEHTLPRDGERLGEIVCVCRDGKPAPGGHHLGLSGAATGCHQCADRGVSHDGMGKLVKAPAYLRRDGDWVPGVAAHRHL